MADVLVARVRVGAEVLVVVAALEVLVHLDHPVHLVAHVRPQHLGGDPRVIRDADRLADVVTQRGDHELVVGAGALGEGGGLQRVRELVDGEAVGDAGQAPQQAEHRLGDAILVGERLLNDHAPLLGGRLVHAGERLGCLGHGSILPQMSDERAMWLGAAVAIVASLLLTTVAAAFESSLNGPGSRTVAPPVLWAFGGGVGLVLGAVVASSLSRRAWPGIFAAVVGAVPFLILVIVAYNSSDLRAEDQVVGSLIVVVLPGLVAACRVCLARGDGGPADRRRSATRRSGARVTRQ